MLMQTKLTCQAGCLTAEPFSSFLQFLNCSGERWEPEPPCSGEGVCMDMCACLCVFLMVSARVVCAIEACDKFQPATGVPGGDARALYHPCSCGARTKLISRHTPSGSKVQQDGNPIGGKNLLCFTPGCCSRGRCCLHGPLCKPSVWVQGFRNVFSQSLRSREFSLVPQGAHSRSLPRIQHLHN